MRIVMRLVLVSLLFLIPIALMAFAMVHISNGAYRIGVIDVVLSCAAFPAALRLRHRL